MKVGIWLMRGILLKERNVVDGATAKLDAGAAPWTASSFEVITMVVISFA